jgi:hypothetical protein
MDINFGSDIDDLWPDSHGKKQIACDEPVYDEVSPLTKECCGSRIQVEYDCCGLCLQLCVVFKPSLHGKVEGRNLHCMWEHQDLELLNKINV